jgi:glycoprotein 6-alpha-L-fucosyltransferase
MDIYYLSKCDYLVCTFSSQVCRMSYELMQIRYGDASWRFKSLDDIYYFGGQNSHYVIAVANHKPQSVDEIEIKIGDKIGIAGNHWNGYSKGTNMRTNQMGLFPSYKVKDYIEMV